MASFGMSDRDRNLSSMGQSNANLMSKYLCKKIDGKLDLIYSSPAVRAKSTAHIFHSEFNMTVNIDIRTEIYAGDIDDILYIISTSDKQNKNIAIFGHNPTLTYLINHLASANIGSIPTCGIAELLIRTDDWGEIHPNNIELKSVISPKSIKH